MVSGTCSKPAGDFSTACGADVAEPHALATDEQEECEKGEQWRPSATPRLVGGRQRWRRERRRARPAQGLELLSRDDEHAAQVPRAVAVAALLAHARLLLRRERSGITERVAAVVVADPLDVAGSLVDQAEERTDVLGPLGELREERAAFSLANGLRGRLLLALASTEHGTSWRGRA